jgi:Fic family protein
MKDFNNTKPYNGLPLLPPKTILETAKVLRKTNDASRALAQLNGMLTNLPNPTLFLDTIHLQEAKASSEIENIITTNDDLYKSLVADKKFDNPATKEGISYKEALYNGLRDIEKLPFISTNLCIEIVQSIKKNKAGIRTTPRIALKNAQGQTIYTPPTGESIIREKLANLETFINSKSELGPLIKMALMHYQFEAIHPFSDGNGRTGKILLLLYLKLEKLLDTPAIYLSKFIIKNKSDYFTKLRLVTENNDWESWVLHILEMVEYTANNGLKHLKDVTELMEVMSIEIKQSLPKVYTKELVEILFRLPLYKKKIPNRSSVRNTQNRW